MSNFTNTNTYSNKNNNSNTNNTSSSNKLSFNFCNNCGKLGHNYQLCKMPITSIGFIAFTNNNHNHNSDNINDDKNIGDKNKFKFLMIRRKDSLGYVDFLRGRYKVNNLEYLQNMINEMTNDEKHRLLNKGFDELWTNLWGCDLGMNNRGEEKLSRDKFNNLRNGISIDNKFINLENIIKKSNTNWIEPEWGFPKGRRNNSEKDLDCAIREFEEETGYLYDDMNIIHNILPFEEIFIGSNYKSYKHKYFLAHIEPDKEPQIKYQETEVSKIEWKTIEECISSIRYYNLEKIDLIKKINEILYKYTIYY